MKPIKTIILIVLLIISGYILFPKNIGFTEKMSEGGITIGEYYKCFGIKLSEESGGKILFRCIGIPFGKITI